MSVHGRSMSRCRSLAPLSCWCWDSRNGWRCSRRRRDAASGTRCWTVSRLTTRSSTPGARIACATTSLAAACGETTWNRGEGRRRRLHSEWILNEVEWKKWEWRCKGWITIGNFHLFIIWFAIGERIVCEIDSFIINKKNRFGEIDESANNKVSDIFKCLSIRKSLYSISVKWFFLNYLFTFFELG